MSNKNIFLMSNKYDEELITKEKINLKKFDFLLKVLKNQEKKDKIIENIKENINLDKVSMDELINNFLKITKIF